MTTRHTDSILHSAVRTYCRSERFFRDDRGWYFTTREDSIMGPYWTRKNAEISLKCYIAYMQRESEKQAEPSNSFLERLLRPC